MKNIVLLVSLLFSLTSNYSISQDSFTSYRLPWLQKFYNSQTIVPITGIDSVDLQIKNTLDQNWTFTKIKYVSENELYKYLQTDTVSIIDLFTYSVGYGSTGLCLFIPADINITRMSNVIASVPIKCSHGGGKLSQTEECGFNQISYKIDILLLQLIEIVNFIEDNHFSRKQAHIYGMGEYPKRFNLKTRIDGSKDENRTQIKPLLVNETVFNHNLDSVEFKELYKHEISIVSDQEYKQRISSGDSSHFILLFSNTPYAVISVFDLERKKTLFVDVNMVDSMLPLESKIPYLGRKQVKRMNKQIKAITKRSK